MNKFNQLCNQIITEIKYRDISQINILNKSIPTEEYDGLLFEDCAFHKLPRQFADKLINVIKTMKENKQVEQEIDIRNYLKLIQKDEVHNFDQFFEFIQLLINSTEEKILTIQLTNNENSFTEPIELYELSNQQYGKPFKDEPYKDSLIKKIKNKSLSNALKIMKENINQLTNLGTIKININTITDDNFEFDNEDTIIGHEIRHFIIFLQRLSKTNYEVCKHYSNQNINFNPNYPDSKSYFLNEDEFITISSTYIERLINIFLKYKRSAKIQEINLLIKSILVKTRKI